MAGSMHYFRIHPDLWEDRIKRVRAMGFNAIQTYSAWFLHEPTEGNIDFSSPGLNISRYFELAQKNGLNILYRPGPYICSEADFGGLPYWLMNKNGIKLREYETNYIAAVTNYFNKLLDVIQPLTYKNGGPILMIQIENEYGVLVNCDHTYTQYLRDLVWNKLGKDTVLYTVDQTDDRKMKCGHIPGVFSTVDFGNTDNDTIRNKHFKIQQKYADGGPMVTSEFWNTDQVRWGINEPSKIKVNQVVQNMEFMHSIGASFSMWIVHAGTNFGWIPGGRNWGDHDGQMGTSYGTCQPVAENGDITPFYTAIRSMIGNLANWDSPPLDILPNNPMLNYGKITMKLLGNSLISTLIQLQEPCVQSQNPMTFEQLNHGYGYVLYTTTVQKFGSTLNITNIRDFAYVFVNNVYKGILGTRLVPIKKQKHLNINVNSGDILRILVENGGRENYWHDRPVLEPRGLGNVTLDNLPLQNWSQCGINLTEASVNSLTSSKFLIEEDCIPTDSFQPGVYIGTFNANVSQDTFFDSTGWGKGQLFVNGWNVGRYWPLVGPQMTLYVPGPIIKTQNTVVLIELNGATIDYANFIDHPIFYPNNNNVNHWGCILNL